MTMIYITLTADHECLNVQKNFTFFFFFLLLNILFTIYSPYNTISTMGKFCTRFITGGSLLWTGTR